MMVAVKGTSHQAFFLLFYRLSSLIRPTSANCFLPNGTDRNVVADPNYAGSLDEYYAPCNPGATASMCCAIGPGRSGNPDTCSSNGLCLSSDGTTWWRESCTDPTWTDPSCVKLYINGTYNGAENSANDIPMTRCPDGSYCTGTGDVATPCCDNNQGYFILANLTVTQQNPNAPVSTTSSTSTTSTSTTSSTSSVAVPSSSSATSPTATSSSSSGLGTGAKAGIGIGAAVAVLAILGLLFWVIKLRKSNGRGRPEKDTHNVASPPPPAPLYDPPKAMQPAPVHEVYGTPAPRSGPYYTDAVEMEQPGAQIPRR